MESRLKYVSGWKKKLKALVPRRIKYTLLADAIDGVLAHTSLLDGGDEPPRLIEYGGGGFVPVGNALVGFMSARAGLVDGMKVLDIGSGIGRSAVALGKRFAAIEYTGFDIVRYGVRWCSKRFAHRPAFRFVHADIYNSFYNPRGVDTALTYAFPAADRSVDFVFATSVFTHMPRAEVARYLRESVRCMKPGATAYFTCFMLDEESRQQIAAGRTLFRFAHVKDGGFVDSLEEPDLAVAFGRDDFESLAAECGLQVEAFFPGQWRGLAYDDYQDAYVLRAAGRA